MPPVRLDQLVIGQQYYLRDAGDLSQGPWGGGPLGLQPFTYDGGGIFYITTNPIVTLNSYGGNWLFYRVLPAHLPPPLPPRPLPPPLPYGGHLLVSDNATNVATMESIADGDELVNWNMHADLQGRRESNFGYYYTQNTYNKLPDPKISPTTRTLINTKNPRRYTALLPAFPSGSANAGLFKRTRSKKTRSNKKGKSRKNKLYKRS